MCVCVDGAIPHLPCCVSGSELYVSTCRREVCVCAELTTKADTQTRQLQLEHRKKTSKKMCKVVRAQHVHFPCGRFLYTYIHVSRDIGMCPHTED